jgi:hypothetical protein
MRWSQLKTHLEALRAPALKKRVGLHQARYRYTLEEVGRVWLTIDGREVISFDTSSHVRRRAELNHELATETADAHGDRAVPAEADDRAREILRAAGRYGDYEAIKDLETFLALSIEDALTSPSPLVRGLAVIDRRVGKRRLRSLEIRPEEHPLVCELYRLRCEAEGIRAELSRQ